MSGFREGDFARFRRSEKYRKIGQTVDSRPVADIRVTTHALGKYFPEDSSHHPMPVRQIFSLLLIITGLAVLTFYVPGLIDLLISLGCGLIALFYLIGMLKFEIAQPPETLLPEAELPFYSVLIPLFKEAHMVQQISKAMQNIDYPPDRIEFLYLTEAKDLQTRHAVMQAFETSMLDNRLIIVPEGIPQTKPRACNFALWQAMGELCVIFDAEDIPHPLQLREAATRFARSGNRLACLQAPLVITRPPRFSLLGRQMALEYLHLFYFVIPTLINLQLPVPLGGTSNHLRKDVMLELKGWDSWNVTEDADLGFRLARRNYRVEQIAYPTHEAATRGLGNYIRQRTRWQKGQMQTWLVRTRHPLKFIRQTGLFGFLVFNIITISRCLTGLAHTYAASLILLSVTGLSDFSSGGIHLFTLTSYLVILASYLAVCVKMNRKEMIRDGIYLPGTWLLTGIASIRAMRQLFTVPTLWEKTLHHAESFKNLERVKGIEPSS